MSQTEAPAAAPFKYRAFISYSHRDAGWADWLHKAVERYRVPRALVGRTTAQGVVTARLTPLFRDREELAASTDLSAVITGALQAASHLVVLCSPRSAQSKWVNAEILAFKRLGREDRIVAIIVDGEPNSGNPATECFPEALKFRIGAGGDLTAERTEPVAADARDTGDGKDNAKLKLIAGLLGVGLDELKRRELQAQRRRMAFAYGLTGVFALLAIGAGILAFIAMEQSRIAGANLKAGIDSANTLTINIARKLRNAEGIRKAMLIEILKPTTAMLDALAATQDLGPDVRLTRMIALNELAIASHDFGRMQDALATAERAVALSEAQHVTSDTEAAIVNERVLAFTTRGDVLWIMGRVASSVESYASALDVAAALIDGRGSDPAITANYVTASNRTGTILIRRGELDNAAISLKRSEAAIERLAAARPDDPAVPKARFETFEAQAALQFARGDIHGAIEFYRRAIVAVTDWDELLIRATEPPLQIAHLYTFRASIRVQIGQIAEARSDLKTARLYVDRVINLDPTDASAARTKILLVQAAANVEAWGADYAAADAFIQEAMALAGELLLRSAGDVADKTLYADLLSSKATIQHFRNDHGGAQKSLDDAIGLLRQALAVDPSNASVEGSLAAALSESGNGRDILGEPEAGLGLLLEARDIVTRILTLNPGDTYLRFQLAVCHVRLWRIYEKLGRIAEAQAAYSAARELLAALTAAFPDNANFQAAMADLGAAPKTP